MRTVKGHFYCYLVSTRESREVENEKGDLVVEEYWLKHEAIEMCDMHEVAGKLGRELNDVRYESKTIAR